MNTVIQGLPLNSIVNGDCLQVMRTWPEKSINCVVSSPPYWGLRKYIDDDDPAKRHEIGLESTPEEFIAKMVEVFREVKRILRDDGVIYVNLGDSYQNKQKMGMPHRVVLALQADGWIWRDEIVWFKPNPMPSSVTDRTTPSHEFIYMLTKKKRYWYDADAIKEPCVESNASRPRMGQGPNTQYNQKRGEATGIRFGGSKYGDSDDPKHATKSGNEYIDTGTRNNRSVWRIDDHNQLIQWLHENHPDIATEFSDIGKPDVWTVPTRAYSECHFATFPPDLITPCILAGCPQWVCSECGEPRSRIMETSQYRPAVAANGERFVDESRGDKNRKLSGAEYNKTPKPQTTGWTRCKCNAPFRPGITCDPFMGSGTVAEVAIKNQRDYVGTELSTDYMKFNGERTQAAETGIPVKEARAGQMPLF